MKKLLFSVFIIALALVLLAQQDVLWSRLQFLDAPRVHVIQKGESLSRLAQKNYGDTDYWRELALINRAPKPDHIQPGEEVLLPASNVIQELRRARTISRVNDLINEQQALAVRDVPAPQQSVEAKSEQTADAASGGPLPEQVSGATDESANTTAVANSEAASNDPPRFAVDYSPLTEPAPSEDSSSWFWVIFGLLALGGVVGFVVYRRRQEEQELAHMQEEKFQGNGENRRKQEARNFQTDRRPHTTNQLEKAAV